MKKTNTFTIFILLFLGIIFPLFVWCLGLCFQVPYLDMKDSIELLSNDGVAADYAVHVDRIPNNGTKYLMLQTKGCAVTVYVDNEVLYEYGHQYMEECLSIGPAYLRVPISEKETVPSIRVHLDKQDANAIMELIKARVCDDIDSTRFYLTNDSLVLPMAFVFFIVSICGIPIYVTLRLKFKENLIGLYMFGVALCLSFILLAQEGHFLIFTGDQHTYYYIVWVSRFLIPIFLAMFFRAMRCDRLPKMLFLVLAIMELILLCSTIACEWMGKAHLYHLGKIYLGSIILFVIVGLFDLVRNYKTKRISSDVTRFSVSVLTWCLCLSFVSLLIRVLFHGKIVAFSTYTIMAMGFFYAICFGLLTHIHESHGKRMARENEIQKLEIDLLKSQLINANNQVQPHYLFNVINSIQEIIFIDPNQAAEILGDFAVHLRGIIRMMNNDQEVPFSEELKNIKAYVNVEKMRFGERLKIEYDIEAEDFPIVPFGIQPIVENAIRHGIYQRGQTGGTVLIKSKEEDLCWVIQVIDDGVGFKTEDVLGTIQRGEKDSTGLKNLIFRLEIFKNAEVQIESQINVGTTVTIRIPK